jgi:hypothetical protein
VAKQEDVADSAPTVDLALEVDDLLNQGMTANDQPEGVLRSDDLEDALGFFLRPV